MVIIATNYQGYGDGIGDGVYHEWLDEVDGIDDDGVEGVGDRVDDQGDGTW